LKAARSLLRPFAPALIVTLDLAAQCCLLLNKVVGWSYLRLWPIFGIYWFDHTFDHLLAPGRNRSTERGTLANRYIKPGDAVLDVACGDGSLSADYYSREASHVDAFDYDERAIRHARKKHAKHNVIFFVADATVIELLPEKYDVIALFAVLEHLSEEEGTKLLRKLTGTLKPDGVLIGSTLLTNDDDSNLVHRNRFSSVQKVKKLVAPHFDQVDLWCSRGPNRIDCYFECRLPHRKHDTDAHELSKTGAICC